MASALATNAQTRAWCFTLNNPVRDVPTPATEDPTQWGASYLVYQLEQGESGTPHFQGYLYFPSNRRLAALRRLAPRAHFEPRRGTHDQARDYCRKDEGRLDGPWEQGEPPAPGKRNDLMLLMADVKTGMSEREIAEKYGATWARNHNAIDKYRRLVTNGRSWKTQVTVLYGPAGTGKSRWAYQQNPDAYPFRGGSYWCGYDCHDHVVIDDYLTGTMPYGVALHVLDRYPLIIDIKVGSKPFVARTIVITSNYPPDTWYPNQRSEPLLRRLDRVIYIDMDGRPHPVKGDNLDNFEGSPSPDRNYPYDLGRSSRDPPRPPPTSSSSADPADRNRGGSRLPTPWQEAQDFGATSRLLLSRSHYQSPSPPGRPCQLIDLEAGGALGPSLDPSPSGPSLPGERLPLPLLRRAPDSSPSGGPPSDSDSGERRPGPGSPSGGFDWPYSPPRKGPTPGCVPRGPPPLVDLASDSD